MNRRWRSRAELLVAVVLGTVVYNLHPTRIGNPLTALWSWNETRPFEGMPLEQRALLYAVLTVLGATLLIASLAARRSVRQVEAVVAGARAGGALLTAALCGLLLDYRDGPQAWVHLAVFVTLTLSAVRTGRLVNAVLEPQRELERT